MMPTCTQQYECYSATGCESTKSIKGFIWAHELRGLSKIREGAEAYPRVRCGNESVNLGGFESCGRMWGCDSYCSAAEFARGALDLDDKDDDRETRKHEEYYAQKDLFYVVGGEEEEPCLGSCWWGFPSKSDCYLFFNLGNTDSYWAAKIIEVVVLMVVLIGALSIFGPALGRYLSRVWPEENNPKTDFFTDFFEVYKPYEEEREEEGDVASDSEDQFPPDATGKKKNTPHSQVKTAGLSGEVALAEFLDAYEVKQSRWEGAAAAEPEEGSEGGEGKGDQEQHEEEMEEKKEQEGAQEEEEARQGAEKEEAEKVAKAAQAEANAEEGAQVKAKTARLAAEADAKAKAEADMKAKAEAEADIKAKAEAEADMKAKAEAEADMKAKAEAEADMKAKAEAEAGMKAKAEAEAQAHAEA